MWQFQIKGPSGEQIQDFRDKTSDKFEFRSPKSGVHKFCFTNKSPYHETIDFDVHVGFFSYFDQHAKDGTMILSLSLMIIYYLNMLHIFLIKSEN